VAGMPRSEPYIDGKIYSYVQKMQSRTELRSKAQRYREVRGRESETMPPEKVSNPVNVLLAEDNPGDVLMMRAALDKCFPDIEVWVQPDGEQMMQWIDWLDRGAVPRPDVILLDLNLPRVTGEEVLWRLGQSRLCRGVPTVIVTASDSPRDRIATAGLGATRYFRKPTDYNEFMQLGNVVKAVLASAGVRP
jgi:chemotaxis family two-component system response regulator Rcp1